MHDNIYDLYDRYYNFWYFILFLLFFFFFLFDPQVSQGFVSCLFVAMVLEVFMLWLDDNLDT